MEGCTVSYAGGKHEWSDYTKLDSSMRDLLRNELIGDVRHPAPSPRSSSGRSAMRGATKTKTAQGDAQRTGHHALQECNRPFSHPLCEAHVQDGERVSHAIGFRAVERTETVVLVETDGLVILLVHIYQRGA